jgi:hypothetical protein
LVRTRRTQKQLETQRVMRSLYIPLPLAERIDERSEQYGLSANKFINLVVTHGLSNDEFLKSAVMGKVESHAPTPEPTEPEPTFSEERSEP